MSLEDTKKGKKRTSKEMMEDSPYNELKKTRIDKKSPHSITNKLNKLTRYNLALMDFLKAIDHAHKNNESDEDEENINEVIRDILDDEDDDDDDGESIDNEDDAISDSDESYDFDLSTNTGLTSCQTESQLSGIYSLDDTIEDTDNLATLDSEVKTFKETREFFLHPANLVN